MTLAPRRNLHKPKPTQEFNKKAPPSKRTLFKLAMAVSVAGLVGYLSLPSKNGVKTWFGDNPCERVDTLWQCDNDADKAGTMREYMGMGQAQGSEHGRMVRTLNDTMNRLYPAEWNRYKTFIGNNLGSLDAQAPHMTQRNFMQGLAQVSDVLYNRMVKAEAAAHNTQALEAANPDYKQFRQNLLSVSSIRFEGPQQ